MNTTLNSYEPTTLEALEADIKKATELGPRGAKGAKLSASVRVAALFMDSCLSTDDLFALASHEVNKTHGWENKKTFVPVFLTNYCDCGCKMCGLRKGNSKVLRKFSSKKVIEGQLHSLYEDEHIRQVGLLTGEYEGEYTRFANAFLIGWSVRKALDMGFEHVYFNIGSMDDGEIEVLAEWLEPGEPVTMCVFQETYDRDYYARFIGEMGSTIPKADFDQRIRSFDKWINAGFSGVNPGALIGLKDPEWEISSLAGHIEYLQNQGASVVMSMPRLRPATGNSLHSKVDRETYRRLISVLTYTFPQFPFVLTTREDQEFQDMILPIIGVLSPGSPDVSPYGRVGKTLANHPSSSQFNIPDVRRPSGVLARATGLGYNFDGYSPP